MNESDACPMKLKKKEEKKKLGRDYVTAWRANERAWKTGI